MGVLDRVVLATLPYVPRLVMRRIASRYIAGEVLGDALQRLRDLAGRGHPGILDLLGEDVTNEDAARAVARSYREAAVALSDSGLDAYLSVKPTHIGLRLSEELAHELYSSIARVCSEHEIFLRVEMEDHTTTDATLRVFERLRQEFDCVGIVLQSRLLRTPQDIASLAPGPLSVRLVKGVYLEPAEIAHVAPEPIREAFVEACRGLFERGAHVSLATHDDVLAERLIRLCRRLELGPDAYEFQVLMGVREPLWETWRRAGHSVRVYVPYGPQWRAYSTRRLRKNPEIVRHVLRGLLPGAR